MTRPTFLDTNVVVRYIMGTPPEQASHATEIIEGGDIQSITGVCLVEAYYYNLCPHFVNKPGQKG